MNQGLSFRVNPLFLVIVIVFSLIGMYQEILIAFTIVLIHELVHMLIAIKAGYEVNRIELFLFGGVAEFKGLLEMDPGQEIKIALAGPFFNLFVAVILYLIRFLFDLQENWLDLFLKYNLIIGIFNLIPALPLDGGRVLRACLVAGRGFQRGTRQAILIAKLLAFIGAIAGFVSLLLNATNIWFLFIAFFVYGVALKEEKQVLYRLLGYLTHREDMVRSFKIKPIFIQIVQGRLSVQETIYTINPAKYNLFYILDQDIKLAGILTETQLISSFFNTKDKQLQVIDILDL